MALRNKGVYLHLFEKEDIFENELDSAFICYVLLSRCNCRKAIKALRGVITR